MQIMSEKLTSHQFSVSPLKGGKKVRHVPNSFQLPNSFVDEVMCNISDSSVKLYLVIVRKTRGWGKEMDSISLSQFEKFTGKSRPTVVSALKELIKHGIVIEKKSTVYGNSYALNDECFIGVRLKFFTSKKSLLVKKFNYASKKSLLLLVKKFNTQNQLSKPTNTKPKGNGSSQPKKPQTETSLALEIKFDEFWNKFPRSKRKGSRSDALKTFTKFEKFSDQIITVLEKFKMDEQWIKDDGAYIPSPSSWLNKKHWENPYWTESIQAQESQLPINLEQPQPIKPPILLRKEYKGAKQ